MDHYLELTLLPDPEFSQAMLMNALLAKLHRALHDLRRNDVGVSFPEYRLKPQSLGTRLRVHGCIEALEHLQAVSWLSGMHDHAKLAGPEPVPDGARYRSFARVQVDSSPERLRRRLMKRHDISEDEAQRRIPNHLAKHCDLPYAQLRSHSNGQGFKLFIQQGPLLDHAQVGPFGGYGLSGVATVPWF